MRNLHRSLSTARQSGGFTLVELLVVIGIIAILAGVALGPITNGIKKAQESGAMQTCRTIAIAEFQYANDNNGSYPGGTADVICKALMSGNYVSDPGLFYLTPDKTGTVSKATSATSFTVANDSFDFMDNGTATGVGSTAPDQLPLVWNEGEVATDTVPAANTGVYIDYSTGTPAGVFGKDGIAVAYHSNNAFFRAPAGQDAPAPATHPKKGEVTFIDQSFDPGSVTYKVEVGASGK